METTLERPQSTRRTRNYSDGEKAKALITLDLCGGNLSKASRETGIPLTTIKDWNDGKITNDITEARNGTKESLADLCEQAAYEFIEQARTTVESSKGTQAATGAAIFIDKMRLLRDQSTVNVAVNSYAQTIIQWAQNSNKTPDEIEPKLQAIADANGLNLAELRAAVFGSQSE